MAIDPQQGSGVLRESEPGRVGPDGPRRHGPARRSSGVLRRCALGLWAALLAAIGAGCTPSSDCGTAPASQPVEPSPSAPAAPEERPTGRRVRKSFDAIRDNGPIFAGWPAPRLAIVITGRQDGYLEPCGCAGLDRMRGGLARRQTMIESLRTKGWPLVLLDVGGLSQRAGPQAMLKLCVSVEAMTQMGYDAIGLGTAELRFPAAELLTLVTDNPGRPGRFVSANVGLFGPAGKIVPKTRIIRAGGMTLGVTSVLGRKYQREIHNPDVEMSDPEAALAPLISELRAACDVTVLLAHATREESAALARRFPSLDVVVIADGPPVPPAEPVRIEGQKTLLVEVGQRVKDAIVLGIFGDPREPLRYQRVPLDSRFVPSAAMKARMARYQDELRQLGLEGLGVRPVPHPRKELMGDFVGAEKCMACHEASHAVWKKSEHATAAQTLVGLDPPRTFDPECIACHMTGWHPQGCFPYESGYLGLDATPKLAAVGCEDCHGPGSAHAAAEAGADEPRQTELRAAVRLTQAEAQRQVCPRCHDATNSPDFEYEAYWPDVAHAEDK
jgi:hypothetical protein